MAPLKEEDFCSFLPSCRVLVVGAGGIGCELLKNLVLTGFTDIEVIDLDTIDVSNLNRQFLFQKKHVGRSKAEVAKESALRFNPKAKIIAHHDSITKPTYGVGFYQKFNIVMNALDNRAARNHVNRLCLAADIPLVESGTAGYLGQVTVIKKGLTECYECQPKPAQKTFPGCTIRNTPSEPIHCIVWAKHLFNQLFGEADPDEDVSPDAADPEQVGQAGQASLGENGEGNGNLARVSTRGWAASHGYCPQKLFTKLFSEDIHYLLSMDKLWEKRKKPTPLVWDSLPQQEEDADSSAVIADQRLWSVTQCRDVFRTAVNNLHNTLKGRGEDAELVWDKDDPDSLDFVTACANIRAEIFSIQRKTRFDVKSMAGNIIPAIATTNAVIAGLIVLEGLKVLAGQISSCRTTYLNRRPNPRGRLVVPCALDPPSAKCTVCSERPEISLRLAVSRVTVGALQDRVLKGALNMVAPDVEISDGRGTILLSSEEGETDGNLGRVLKDFNIVDGTRLVCDDFLQSYNLVVNIIDSEQLENGQEFEIIGDPEQLKKAQEEKTADSEEQTSATAGSSEVQEVDDEADLVCLDDEEAVHARKRENEDEGEEEEQPPKKRVKSGVTEDGGNGDGGEVLVV